MAKWYGSIGFNETAETDPGVWESQVTERPYYGELLQNFHKTDNSGGVNDDVNITNKISIIADPYAYHNFSSMRYIEFMDTMWKITNIEVKYPRLILTLGGVWNGKQATTAEQVGRDI